MLIAVSMMRDEADVAEAVVTHLWAHGVDHIIVADNLSKDGTGDLLRAQGVEVVEDAELGYYQDRKMSALAAEVYEDWDSGPAMHDPNGPSVPLWILPFDADEIWYPTDGGTLGEFFAKLPEDVDVVEARGWDHIATPVDEPGHPFRNIQHRRQAKQKLPKVAFRACPDPYVHMGNHDVDRHQGNWNRVTGLSYRHFQYRSLEQFKRKVRNGREAYEASDLHWNYGTHWRIAGAKSDAELEADWWAMCGEEGLIVDPAPVLP